MCVWAIIFILYLYKYDYVYIGSGPGPSDPDNAYILPNNYMDEEKSGFILSEVIWCVIELGIYILWFFDVKKYADSYWRYLLKFISFIFKYYI